MRCPKCQREMTFEPEGWTCKNKAHAEIVLDVEVMAAKREAAGEILNFIMVEQLSIPDKLINHIRRMYSL